MTHSERTRRAGPGRLLLLGLGLAALSLGGASACSSTPPPPRSEMLLQGLERLDAAVRTEVSDPVGRQEALALVDGLRRSELEFLDAVGRSRAALWELSARHDASREELMREVEGLNALRRAFRDELVGTYLALRETVGPDEYPTLVRHLRAEEERWKEVR
jgi:hypothetical protein